MWLVSVYVQKLISLLPVLGLESGCRSLFFGLGWASVFVSSATGTRAELLVRVRILKTRTTQATTSLVFLAVVEWDFIVQFLASI